MNDWRKSTYSQGVSNCVEVGWRKSTYSRANLDCVEATSFRRSTHCDGGTCIETGNGAGVVGVRDSQLGSQSIVLEFTTATWIEFVKSLR